MPLKKKCYCLNLQVSKLKAYNCSFCPVRLRVKGMHEVTKCLLRFFMFSQNTGFVINFQNIFSLVTIYLAICYKKKKKHTFVMFTPVESLILENSSIRFSDCEVISSVTIAPIFSSKLRIAVSTTPKFNICVPKNNRRTYFPLLLLLWHYSFSWPC